MGAKGALAAIGCGALSAALFLTLLAMPTGVGLLLSNFSPLPILVVGLAVGVQATLVAGAAATVVMAGATDVAWAVSFAVTFAVPALLVVLGALRLRPGPAGQPAVWAGPTGLLLLLVWSAVAVLVALALATLGTPDGLRGALTQALRPVVESMGPTFAQMLGQPAGTISPDDFVQRMLLLIPGFALGAWIVLMIVNAALAQGLLMRMGRNRRPPLRMAEVDLPVWMAQAFAIAVFAAVASPTVLGWYGFHAALVLSVAYFFAGLSVIHAAALRTGMRVPILVVTYLSLLLFTLLTAPVVVGLGLVEHWVRFKQRLARPDRSPED